MSRAQAILVLSLAIAGSFAARADAPSHRTMTPPRAITLCQPHAPGTGEPDGSAQHILAAAARHLDDRPHPLAHVHTEGTLPHQGIRDESIAAERDWPLMRQAALAWRLSADARYLQQVDDYLKAWTGTYQPDFNPIDETNLDGLIDAYVLTSAGLPAATREATRAWLRRLGEGYIQRIQAFHDPKPGTATNNWQSHRVKLVTLAAAALGDPAMLKTARELFERQVGDNIRPDGEVIDFTERDALHYVVYDLQPLVTAALAARPFGDDWLRYASPRGASLAEALDWLRPYAEGSKTHEEFVHTHVKFDRDRAQAGEKGYGGPWDPKSATALYWLAAALDPDYRAVAQRLSPAPPDWIGACSYGQ
ncbi:alginate lyase family protein [Dyella sp. BiH032]|uniref:alginate lyase family protein n=1 Tax=Dyella sp. BiH032 TaxID=3075430 RepID=UPI002892D8C0|nr:alginate lyase family protein [Dyella sp. BiH032]WNL47503.1 alginate lyase family protein [Dyella sp. BiH032]